MRADSELELVWHCTVKRKACNSYFYSDKRKAPDRENEADTVQIQSKRKPYIGERIIISVQLRCEISSSQKAGNK